MCRIASRIPDDGNQQPPRCDWGPRTARVDYAARLCTFQRSAGPSRGRPPNANAIGQLESKMKTGQNVFKAMRANAVDVVRYSAGEGSFQDLDGAFSPTARSGSLSLCEELGLLQHLNLQVCSLRRFEAGRTFLCLHCGN